MRKNSDVKYTTGGCGSRIGVRGEILNLLCRNCFKNCNFDDIFQKVIDRFRLQRNTSRAKGQRVLNVISTIFTFIYSFFSTSIPLFSAFPTLFLHLAEFLIFSSFFLCFLFSSRANGDGNFFFLLNPLMLELWTFPIILRIYWDGV